MGLQERELFTLAEVAKMLAVSPSGVRRLVHKGYLPEPTKIFAASRWHRADIEACLLKLRAESIAERIVKDKNNPGKKGEKTAPAD